jgi:hypothetical protein
MVARMSDNSVDPSGNTEAFRAFTNSAAEPPAAPSRTPLIIAALVGVVLVAVLIAVFVAL